MGVQTFSTAGKSVSSASCSMCDFTQVPQPSSTPIFCVKNTWYLSPRVVLGVKELIDIKAYNREQRIQIYNYCRRVLIRRIM
jgi:hypothetical protein